MRDEGAVVVRRGMCGQQGPRPHSGVSGRREDEVRMREDDVAHLPRAESQHQGEEMECGDPMGRAGLTSSPWPLKEAASL